MATTSFSFGAFDGAIGERSVIEKASCCDQDVLWFHIPMKVAICMNVIQTWYDLTEDGRDKTACKGTSLASFDKMV